MKKIKTSALIGLGALGILFGRKMPGVQVIADEDRIARSSADPVVCNGEACSFRYVTPAEGKPVDLLLVAVKATVLEQAIQDIAKFVGPDTVILSVLNGITSEEHIDAAYPGHTLWSVAIGMDATRTGRTLVFNQAGKIQFGERSGEMTDRVQAVADYLDECGIANEPCGDILYKQWNKLMVNDGLNQAAAASGTILIESDQFRRCLSVPGSQSVSHGCHCDTVADLYSADIPLFKQFLIVHFHGSLLIKFSQEPVSRGGMVLAPSALLRVRFPWFFF